MAKIEIDENTIRYDDASKRFLTRGLLPKIPSVGITAGVSAGVAALASLIPVVGAVVGGAAIAGGVAAAGGAALSTVYHGVYYHDNLRKKIFKKMGLDAAITNVKSAEKKAEQYADAIKTLESSSDKNIEVTIDGPPKKMSRRKLYARMREYEDIAHHGLRYIYDEAKNISGKVEHLESKDLDYIANIAAKPVADRNDAEKKDLADYQSYRATLEKIRDCTKEVIKRFVPNGANQDVFNPYKGLIMESLKEGCLLVGANEIGAKEESKDIKNIKADISPSTKAREVYHKLFEAKEYDDGVKTDLEEKCEEILDKAEDYKPAYPNIQTKIDELNNAITSGNTTAMKNAYNKLDRALKVLDKRVDVSKVKELIEDCDKFLAKGPLKDELTSDEKTNLEDLRTQAETEKTATPIDAVKLAKAYENLEKGLATARRKTRARYYVAQKSKFSSLTTEQEKAFNILNSILNSLKDKDDLTAEEATDFEKAAKTIGNLLISFNNNNKNIINNADAAKKRFEALVTDETERKNVKEYTDLRDALGKDPKDYVDIEAKRIELENRIAEINKEAGKTEGLAEGANAEIVKRAKEAVKLFEDLVKDKTERKNVKEYTDLRDALDKDRKDYDSIANQTKALLGWLVKELGNTTSNLATSQQRVSDLEGKIRQTDAELNSALDKNSKQTLKAAEDAYNEAKELKLGDDEAVKKLKAAIDEINGDLKSEKIKDLPSLTEIVGKLNKDNRAAVKDLKAATAEITSLEDQINIAQGAAYDERVARNAAEEERDRARKEAADLKEADARRQENWRRGNANFRFCQKLFVVLNHIDQVREDNEYNTDKNLMDELKELSEYATGIKNEYNITPEEKTAEKLNKLGEEGIKELHGELNKKYESASGYDPKTKTYSKWPNYNPREVELKKKTTNAHVVYGANTTIGG